MTTHTNNMYLQRAVIERATAGQQKRGDTKLSRGGGRGRGRGGGGVTGGRRAACGAFMTKKQVEYICATCFSDT